MMELQGEDGSIVELSETLKKELGRGPGIAAHDRSVSRRQVRLQVQRIAGHFVVINVVGPNPICVVHATTGGDVEVEVVKSGSQSSLNIGDKFSLSIQAPVFYTLSAKQPHRSLHESTDRGKLVVEDDQQGVVEGDEEEGIAEAVARWQRRKQERLQSDQRRSSTDEAEAQQAQDVSQQQLVYSQAVSHEVNEPEQAERPTTSEADTDVAKKFGFIVEGSEFERYGRKGLHTSKWNWRIGRQSDNDDDDDVEERRGLSPNPKQRAKSRDEEDDDDWRGDSEGEKKLLSARKRPSLRKKDVQTRSHNSATASDTRVDPRKKRKLESTSGLENASVEQGKTKLSRQATPSTSTKKSSKRQSRATKDEDEEEDDDGEDLDGFLVDDVDEEDEEVADEEDDEWTDEDEEVEEEDEIDEVPSGARAPGRHGKDKGDGGDDKPLCKYGNKCFRKNKDHLAEFRH